RSRRRRSRRRRRKKKTNHLCVVNSKKEKRSTELGSRRGRLQRRWQTPLPRPVPL
ncbi:hypothetical protein BGZ50_009281, partial [Haplosporangium sp. Z 11]